MKCGITADIHIVNKGKHLERVKALENILDKCLSLDVDQLIIAGDLFDKSLNDFSEFERVCSQKKFKNIQIHVIPGNHDEKISNEKIVSKNVQVYSQPAWLNLSDDLSCLLIPYQSHLSMGEVIQSQINENDLKNSWWFLVGHGDWYQGVRDTNPYEPGIYMPLTQKDLQIVNPNLVFLGHIHKYQNYDKVYYPGSPCGIDISETGKRYFLVFDSETRQVEPVQVEANVMYFDMDLMVLPLENEEKFIKEQFLNQIEAWMLKESDYKKCHLRVTVQGYSTDREKVQKLIRDNLSEFSFSDEPNFECLYVANDHDRNYIAKRARDMLMDFNWAKGPEEPDQEMVTLDALKLIYGE